MRATDWAADFSIFDERGQLAAIAEAKGKTGVDSQWAKDWLRFRLEHERLAGPQFILLATPETMYLWKRQGDQYWPEPLTAGAGQILAPYVSPRLNLATMHGEPFESIVRSWLGELVHGLWRPETPDQHSMIIDSGLLETIESGRVGAHVLA